MLVDLGRNDLGRVCAPGTVKVRELLLGRALQPRDAPGVDGHRAAAARAHRLRRRAPPCFPAGTLSGAPKPRAMEIIEELEPTRRGLYGGIVGYLDFAGDADTAIAIRTALVRDGVAYVQAGRRDRRRLRPGRRGHRVPEQGAGRAVRGGDRGDARATAQRRVAARGPRRGDRRPPSAARGAGCCVGVSAAWRGWPPLLWGASAIVVVSASRARRGRSATGVHRRTGRLPSLDRRGAAGAGRQSRRSWPRAGRCAGSSARCCALVGMRGRRGRGAGGLPCVAGRAGVGSRPVTGRRRLLAAGAALSFVPAARACSVAAPAEPVGDRPDRFAARGYAAARTPSDRSTTGLRPISATRVSRRCDAGSGPRRDRRARRRRRGRSWRRAVATRPG